jgi:hypothetical protein
MTNRQAAAVVRKIIVKHLKRKTGIPQVTPRCQREHVITGRRFGAINGVIQALT